MNFFASIMSQPAAEAGKQSNSNIVNDNNNSSNNNTDDLASMSTNQRPQLQRSAGTRSVAVTNCTDIREEETETAATPTSLPPPPPADSTPIRPVDRRLLYKGSLGAVGESVRRLSITMQTSLSNLHKSTRHLLHLDDDDSDDDNDTTATSEDENDIIKQKINWILDQLTQDELQLAAATDYEYLTQYTAKNMASQDQQRKYATTIAHRYLASKKGNKKLALKKLRSTLQFRKEKNVADLMTAFDATADNNDNDDGGDDLTESTTEGSSSSSSPSQSKRQHIQQKLHHHLSSEKMYVQGYDKDGRATFIFRPRCVKGHDKEWTLKEAVYTMERAIACSARRHRERAAASTNDDNDNNDDFPTINAVVDCAGFSAWKHSPPMEIGKEFMLALRNHYAGQVHKIFILDAPSSFAMLWNLVQPFLGSNTKAKITFVNGKKQRSKLVGQHYATEQASPWMLPGGKQPSTVDVSQYLRRTAFDRVFGE